MPNIIYVNMDGSRSEVPVPEGDSIMNGALNNAIRGLMGECGGCCACATCHVYVEGGPEAGVPPMTDFEDEMLEGVAAPRLPESRLACQLVVAAAMDGLVIRIPERQI